AALLALLERAEVIGGDAHPGGNLPARRLALELVREQAAHRRQLLGAPPDPAHVALVIDDEKVADHARLVAVGLRIVERDGGDHARRARIGDVDDRGAELARARDVPDIGMRGGHAHLAGTGKIEVAEPTGVAGERRSMSVNIVHLVSRCRHSGSTWLGLLPLPLGEGWGEGFRSISLAGNPLTPTSPQVGRGSAPCLCRYQ